MERVRFIERDGKRFFYMDFGSEVHGRTSFRLWINRKLIEKDRDGNEVVRILGKGRRIVKTEKGNYVLKPDPNFCVFKVGWRAGYRGWSEYEVLTPNIDLVVPYRIYHSPRGNLGISEYALVSTLQDRILVRLTRGGRLYGDPSEMTVELIATDEGQEEREVPDACVNDEELAEELSG